MLNPYQKHNLKITSNSEFTPIKDDDKPNIFSCFENIIGTDQTFKSGGRAKITLCPFHGEQNASFAIYEDTNSAHCFSCGWTGDSYKFLMDQLELTFPEAMEYAKDNNLYD